MKRVAIYVRVSTQDQSTELQIRELMAYVEARGWNAPIVFEDKATGTNEQRPAFQALLVQIRSRQVDLVVVWKLDRFARSLKSLITVLQEMQEIGVEFVSIKDNIDLTTSTGRLMFQIIGAFAEFEASLIKERVRAGLANARSKGVKLGRKRVCDPVKVLAFRRAGFTIREIAEKLGVSKSAVAVSLKPRQIQSSK